MQLLHALVFSFATVAFAQAQQSPKDQLMQNFYNYISQFFTVPQLSKLIDITALDIHNREDFDAIVEDLKSSLSVSMSSEQIQQLNAAVKGFRADLGEEAADEALHRTRVAVQQALQDSIVQVKANDATPTHAYTEMARILQPDFARRLFKMIRVSLGPDEWSRLTTRFAQFANFSIIYGQ